MSTSDAFSYVANTVLPAINPYTSVVGTLWMAKVLLLFDRSLYKGFKVFLWPIFRKLNLEKLYGEYVVVTGADHCVGLEFCKQFAERGHSIVMIASDEHKLKRAKEDIELSLKRDRTLISFAIDFTSPDVSVYKEIARQLGDVKSKVGILVNTANYCVKQIDYLDHSDEHIAETLRADMLSILMVTKAILPLMIENKKGLVMNVTAPSGNLPRSSRRFYGSSKEFVNFFAKALEGEYGKYIDLLTINPASETSSSTSRYRRRLMQPTLQQFVSSSIAAIGRSKQTTGFWVTSLLQFFIGLFPEWVSDLFYYIVYELRTQQNTRFDEIESETNMIVMDDFDNSNYSSLKNTQFPE